MVDFLVRKASKIHGLGVFTARDIAEGEVFYEVPVENILNWPKRRCAFIGNNRWVSDIFVLNYVNHGCAPSAIFDVSGEIPKLIATRDIGADEEITVDYNRTETGGTMIPCNCGAESCPGEFATILGPGQEADVLPDPDE
jgi:hypothetical protein